MAHLRLILRLVMLTTLRTADCSIDGVGAMLQGRKISKVVGMASPRALPPDTVYVPYRGSIPNMLLSRISTDSYNEDLEGCENKARLSGFNSYYRYKNGKCYAWTLAAPVCRVGNANETGYMIMESFLTDGSPDDDPFPSSTGKDPFMYMKKPNVAFRVMTPTILQFPEFTTEIGYDPPKVGYEKSDLPGKFFVFPKLGGMVTTDDTILVDPSCHTNNSCGVPFLTTSVEAVQTPHVALDQYCGQTIDLNDTPVLNVISHTGIGCKFFPDPAPNCELTIISPSAITANVTLVNFRKTTCEGYELKFITSTCEVDVCQENNPTVIEFSEGKMQIKITGSASENWDRYGFIIRLENVTKNENSFQCSSDNSAQAATDNFSQVSTTAPDESSANSPVQNPTDGSYVDLTEASFESSSATEFISDPTESFESESSSISPKSPTNSHILHLLLALGIQL